MSEKYIEVWEKCLEIIKDNVTLQSFKTWFKPIQPVKMENDVLTIQVPSLFFYEWLEEHYVNLLRKTIKKVIGPNAKLEYNIVVENSSENKQQRTINMPASELGKDEGMEVSMPLNISNSIKNPFIIPGLKKVKVDPQLNNNFLFENFIEGECNRLARSAGLSIASKPGGTAFNPLFIYSGVGLGKTHLVQAIGNEIRNNFKNKVVLYVQAEQFANQYYDSVRNNIINDFINFYQMIDVLIVDDVQFFANKEKTQDIFFHIFNSLHQNSKQLILTSDTAPKDMKGLEERLLSRFKWGLSTEIQKPDFETRISILENKMHANGITLPKDVVEYIAYHVTSSIRELEGSLISILAQSSFNKREINVNLAKDILKSFIKKSSKELTIEHIQRLVGEHLNVSIEEIKSKTRKRNIVQARQISMYFAKKLTNSSLCVIGKHFGSRDHSTVIHACQTVDDLKDSDPEYNAKLNEIQKLIMINLG
ncbi:MAG TPA: chromosomal replication initiator protein DnaA [Bacteroidia bacterium]|nr:chromosomal replication initiator protein DnaA [Sphingobacteriales bacterium]HPD64993.1 chromosomal replication initiator protein DnaA [Bacteroidia bacterium]HRS58133.1 chromosomal replication initiator protein DnaA [Bacteroidia bacterium]HRU68756.1 chromosomal replication initiator protein DnaA [Bacteroidia bacterium]